MNADLRDDEIISEVADTGPECTEKGRVFEALRRGAGAFVVGCNPRINSDRQEWVRSQDLAVWVEALLAEDTAPYILIADHGLEINLRQNKGASAELKQEVRRVALSDKYMLEAIQEVLLTHPEHAGHAPKDVVLISEILEDEPEFWSLFTSVQSLYAAHKAFRDRVWVDPPQYTLLQVATTLFLQGVKWGHEAERPYDELTDFVLANYGEALGLNPKEANLSYHYLNPVGTQGTVAYRPVDARYQRPDMQTISPVQGVCGQDQASAIECSLFPVVLPSLSRFLRKVQHSRDLSSEQHRLMLVTEVSKLVRQIIMEYCNRPAYRYLLHQHGYLTRAGLPLPREIEGGGIRFNSRQMGHLILDPALLRSLMEDLIHLMQGIAGPISMMRNNTFDLTLWELLLEAHEVLTGAPNDFKQRFDENCFLHPGGTYAEWFFESHPGAWSPDQHDWETEMREPPTYHWHAGTDRWLEGEETWSAQATLHELCQDSELRQLFQYIGLVIDEEGTMNETMDIRELYNLPYREDRPVPLVFCTPTGAEMLNREAYLIRFIVMVVQWVKGRSKKLNRLEKVYEKMTRTNFPHYEDPACSYADFCRATPDVSAPTQGRSE